jgi:hypothetical protein
MDPGAPVTLRLRDRAASPLALDPYSAALIPTPQGGKAQAFFSALRRWHRWIGASAAEARARARMVTGAANLAFLWIGRPRIRLGAAGEFFRTGSHDGGCRSQDVTRWGHARIERKGNEDPSVSLRTSLRIWQIYADF